MGQSKETRTADTTMASNKLSNCIAASSGRRRVSKLETTASFTSAPGHVIVHRVHVESVSDRAGRYVACTDTLQCMHLQRLPHARLDEVPDDQSIKKLHTCISQAAECRHCPRRHSPRVSARKVLVQVL